MRFVGPHFRSVSPWETGRKSLLEGLDLLREHSAGCFLAKPEWAANTNLSSGQLQLLKADTCAHLVNKSLP